jgi:hypothetical protein
MRGNRPKGIVITPRDREFLGALAECRLADREMFQAITGVRLVSRANGLLARLHAARLLKRYYLGTPAGGQKALYELTSKGAAVIGQAKSWTFQHAENELLVGDAFVEHQLAVNWCWISAKYRSTPGIEFLRWLRFQEAVSSTVALIPDGYGEWRKDGATTAVFLEVDLGTESGSVWEKKIALYLKLASSGEFERTFCQPRFKVAVVATSERRLETLRKLISKHTHKIFYFNVLNNIKQGGMNSSLWLRPVGEERMPLL